MDIKKINDVFLKSFGRTPLKQRLEDILTEAIELSRFTDLENLKEECGDLLCSLIQLTNECNWDIGELIKNTLDKIESRKVQYRSLGRKINVALLGGAFDPVHIGHFEIAQLVLDTSKTFDEVWFVPCYEHMYGKEMTHFKYRLEMCRIAVKNDKRIKVFDYEIKKQLKGETYHFVKQLLEEEFARDKYDFSIIIGQDNAETFSKWVNYKYLEKMIRFVIIPRQGIKPKENWYLKPPHIWLNNEKVTGISSTELRKSLDLEGCEHMYYELNKYFPNNEVLKYIVKNKLYERK